jgi:hypothetical protein
MTPTPIFLIWKLTRRRLLALASRTLAYTAVSAAFVPRLFLGADSNTRDAGFSEHELTTLATLSHDLFPHDRLPGSVYQEVAGFLNVRTAGTPELQRLIRKGILGLDRSAGEVTWKDLAYEQRVPMLKEVEDSPFFITLTSLVEDTLYQHPRVWELLGYGGNALEQGGYLKRGFDDIDWLPDS